MDRPRIRDYAFVVDAALGTLLLLGGLFRVAWDAIVNSSWVPVVALPIGIVFGLGSSPDAGGGRVDAS